MAAFLASAGLACSSTNAGGAAPSPTEVMGAADAKPLYALVTLLFNDQGDQTTYLNVVDSLDTQPTITLERAHEFHGYAAAAAWGGKLMLSDGDRPKLTRYAVSSGGDLTEEASIGFGSYTSSPLTATIFATDTRAYSPTEGTSHVAWNPSDFSVVAPVAGPPSIPLKRGDFAVARGYAHAVHGNLVYQPYYWSDPAYDHYSEVSQVEIIDATSDRVAAVADVPCPHVHIVSQDDEGNVYFSNGQGSIPSAVLSAADPHNCFARIRAGETAIDPTFTTSFRDLTGGREGGNFFYVGGGVALFNVYYAERDGVTAGTPAKTIAYSSNYHLWTFDLTTKKAQEMKGIEFAGGQYVALRIDGRAFVAIPAGDYATTAVYEILPTGIAEKRFDVQGWTFSLFRIR